MSNSVLNSSKFDVRYEKSLVETKQGKAKEEKSFNFNLDVLNNLQIEDIMRALTSKIYKHNKSSNYEEF